MAVSTAGFDLAVGLVNSRVVAGAVAPAGLYHAQPGAGEDADGVVVSLLAVSGVVVDLGGPVAAVAAVVGEGGQRDPGSAVGGEAEGNGAGLARCAGFWDDTGFGDELFAGVGTFQDGADLADDLAEADLAYARHGGEQRRAGMGCHSIGDGLVRAGDLHELDLDADQVLEKT